MCPVAYEGRSQPTEHHVDSNTNGEEEARSDNVHASQCVDRGGSANYQGR